MSLSASSQCFESAVGRLDNIFMSLYAVIAALIMAVALDASFTNLLTAAGTLVLGLSWLIGSSAAEVLSSIIFVFIKHPYDVGDSVEISDKTYTVKEIQLLSTIFVDSEGCTVQAAHSTLTTQYIKNLRRSGPESEDFSMDLKYDTAFEKIEELRARMLRFLASQDRHFKPSFDVSIVGLSAQSKMVLSVTIKYKSKNQNSAVKAMRRNMWMCAFRSCLTELEMYGPAGDPNAKSGPTQYTLVP